MCCQEVAPWHIHTQIIPNQNSDLETPSNKNLLSIPKYSNYSFYLGMHISSPNGLCDPDLVYIWISTLSYHVYRCQISPIKYPTTRNQLGIDTSVYRLSNIYCLTNSGWSLCSKGYMIALFSFVFKPNIFIYVWAILSIYVCGENNKTLLLLYNKWHPMWNSRSSLSPNAVPVMM